MLVKTDRSDHRRDFRCEGLIEYLGLGHGIDAPVGDRTAADRKLLGCNAQRTLPRIDIERHVGVVVNPVVILQQPGNRTIVEIGIGFRFIQLVDQHQRTAAQLSEEIRNSFPFPGRITHRFYHTASRNGTRIHQRRRGMVVFEQDRHDRVERQSGCVRTDLLQDYIRAVLFHHEDGGRNLRDGFYTEYVARVSDLDHLTVRQANRETEQRRRHIGQIGNVIGIFAARIAFHNVVRLLYNGFYLIVC